jgi:hypothetical protein
MASKSRVFLHSFPNMEFRKLLQFVVVFAAGVASAVCLIALWGSNDVAPPEKSDRLEPNVMPSDRSERGVLLPSIPVSVRSPRDEGEMAAVNETDQKPVNSDPPDPIVELARLEEDLSADLRAHARDWKDPTWAPSAESSLINAYTSVQGSHKVKGVDCRTTSCVIDLEWPSLSDAAGGYQRLLAEPTEPNCETKILLHPSNGAAGEPYSEKLVLNCVGARAGQAD